MAKTVQSKIEQLRAGVPTATIDELRDKGLGSGAVILDVRERDEFEDGHIPGALHISRGLLELEVEDSISEKNRLIYVYCGSGVRSLFAAETLQGLGYEQVRSVSGGIREWREQGHPVIRPPKLTSTQKARYRRHLMMPQVGESGQLKLLQSKVLLVGAGGLGCPIALYLSAAGVGTIGVVDFDVVDESNLQRQILHSPARVGELKVLSAKKALADFNPETVVQTYAERIEPGNVERIFAPYDLIIDGSDNFQTRYLVNDACLKLKKPCVHGSVFQFEGQVTVFDPNRADSPCYRCLYPEAPPKEFAPSCNEAGVLGVLPGVVGLLEAVEALKHLLGLGDSLVGRLLQFDALAGECQTYVARRDPNCRCGQSPDAIRYETLAEACEGLTQGGRSSA